MLLVGRQAVGWIEDRISDLFVFKVRKWVKYSFIFASAFGRRALQNDEKQWQIRINEAVDFVGILVRVTIRKK